MIGGIEKRKINRFIDYMLTMYGPNGPHADEMIFDERDIRMGLARRLKFRKDLSFEGDLNDMDIVRDMILDVWSSRARAGVL